VPQTGPPAQPLAANALPLAAIDIAAIPASTARLDRRLRIKPLPGSACTGTPSEMLAQLFGGDSAIYAIVAAIKINVDRVPPR
jgi:hypothetical protein